MGKPTSTGGSGPSGNPWVIVFALCLFVIDVPMIGVLYHVTNVYTAIGAAAVVNLAATEAVCRILGRPGGGMASALLRLARALLTLPPGGGESGGAAGALP